MLCEKIQSGHYRGINSARFSWVALGVGVAGAAISAGTSAYSASQQQNAANSLAGSYQAPDYSDAIDYLQNNGAVNYQPTIDYLNTGTNGAANFTPAIDYTKNNWAVPQYQAYQPTSYASGLEDYLEQGSKYAPQIANLNNQINAKDNRQFRQDILQFAPDAARNARRLSANTNDLLAGRIPISDQRQLAAGSAERATLGGFGGSGMARNLTARDFGLTQLQLQQQGAAQLPGSLQASAALSPYQSSTMQSIFNPQQLLANTQSENRFANQTFNANATNTAQFKNQATQAITQLLAQGAISQADKERMIAGIMSKSSESRADVARMIAGLYQQQAADAAGAQNTNSLLQAQAAAAPNPWISGLSSGAGSLASMYGGGFGGLFGSQQPGTAAPSGFGQGSSNYTGSFFNNYM